MAESGRAGRMSLKSNEPGMMFMMLSTKVGTAIHPDIASDDEPKGIKTNITGTITSQAEKVDSENVVAFIRGSEKPDEILVISAHLDHVGVNDGEIDLKDEKFLIIFSFIAIIVGLLNLLFHNVWEPNYKLIITLIGWTSLFLGLALFMLPRQTVNLLNIINVKFVQVIYTLLFLIGVFLLNEVYSIIPI